MSSQNIWSVLATFAEELAPVAQDALNSVSAVSNAVVRADIRLIEEERKYLPPSD